jgi:hypothetical protein
MMADGGVGAPALMGGEPDADDMSAQAPPPPPAGGDQNGSPLPVIKPEAVNYHDDPHSCKICQYFDNGNCSVLQMQVSPDGGCTAFEAGGGEQPPAGGEPGQDMSANPNSSGDGY